MPVLAPGLSRTSTVCVPMVSRMHGTMNKDSGPHSVVPFGRRISTSVFNVPNVAWRARFTVPPAAPLNVQQFVWARAVMLPVWVES